MWSSPCRRRCTGRRPQGLWVVPWQQQAPHRHLPRPRTERVQALLVDGALLAQPPPLLRALALLGGITAGSRSHCPCRRRPRRLHATGLALCLSIWQACTTLLHPLQALQCCDTSAAQQRHHYHQHQGQDMRCPLHQDEL